MMPTGSVVEVLIAGLDDASMIVHRPRAMHFPTSPPRSGKGGPDVLKQETRTPPAPYSSYPRAETKGPVITERQPYGRTSKSGV
jgi:hypothetical protein